MVLWTMLSFIKVCLLQTEKSRFLVFLKEKLCDTKPLGDLTKPDKEICNKSHQHTSRNQETTRQDCSDEDSKLGMEEESNGGRSELISKCLKLLMQKHILERVTSTGQVMMSEPCVFDVLTFLEGYIVHLCTVSERVVVEYLVCLGHGFPNCGSRLTSGFRSPSTRVAKMVFAKILLQ